MREILDVLFWTLWSVGLLLGLVVIPVWGYFSCRPRRKPPELPPKPTFDFVRIPESRILEILGGRNLPPRN